MRTKNSIINAIISVSCSVFTLIISWVAQIFFVKALGKEYLGVNGLFTNIIAVLGLVELGIGTAIVFHLYKPIAENDEKKVAALTNYYRKCYNIIAIVIAIIGLSLIPVLPYIVEKTTVNINLNLVYILILSEVVLSYLLSYKRNILYVNQKHYITNLFHIAYVVILNISCILCLIYTKNYILYLIIKSICKFLENLVISLYVDKKYTYLKKYKNEVIDNSVKKDIKKQVKALFTHSVAGYVINGTDNVLISKFFGVIYVGLYSNYYMVILGAKSLLSQIFVSAKASVGNLLVLSDGNKCYEIFRKLNLVNYFIYTMFSICFCLASKSFITYSYGTDYVFDLGIVISITFNFYLQGLRQSPIVFKEAAGIFYEDRFVPIIESIVNIVTSIIFLKIMGIAGVFVGTICSNLILHLYSYPKFVYKKLFKRKQIDYIVLFFKQLLLFSIVLFLSLYVSRIYVFNNPIIEFFKNGLLGAFIWTIIFMLIYRKTEEYKYFIQLIFKRKKKVC